MDHREQQIELALEAYRLGEFKLIRLTGRAYNIPKSTL